MSAARTLDTSGTAERAVTARGMDTSGIAVGQPNPAIPDTPRFRSIRHSVRLSASERFWDNEINPAIDGVHPQNSSAL